MTARLSLRCWMMLPVRGRLVLVMETDESAFCPLPPLPGWAEEDKAPPTPMEGSVSISCVGDPRVLATRVKPDVADGKGVDTGLLLPLPATLIGGVACTLVGEEEETEDGWRRGVWTLS